jgi:calcineurin-like phosphoesterase family protein
MASIWFTSDTHFGHENIIKYCSRPFSSVEEMDETLIENYNKVVKPEDLVYHLGDFALVRPERVIEYRKRLHGTIHLISGNHDRWVNANKKDTYGFAWIGSYKEIKVLPEKICLMHYALKTWNGMHRGSYMLHGHSHGKLGMNLMKRRMDVGVDPCGYKPISLEEVDIVMKKINFTSGDQEEL